MKSFSIGVIRDTERGKTWFWCLKHPKMNKMKKIVSVSEKKKNIQNSTKTILSMLSDAAEAPLYRPTISTKQVVRTP